MGEVQEALKELVRVMILAAIPVVIVSFEQGVISYKAIGFSVAIAVLRAVDKWLHEKESKYQLPI